MRMEFYIFEQTLEFMLTGMEIPKEKWYLYILQQFGREGMEQWNASIKGTVDTKDPHAIIKAFKTGYELEETYWTYRSLYLSSAKQSQGESVAALTTTVEDLVNMCKWLEEQKEQRCIDLFYHLTDFFDVKCYMQNETARYGRNLTWEKLTEEAKHQERVGKEYAKFRRENGGGGTPSYGDPALAADAVSRLYKKPQQRSWTPSGGKGGGKSQKQCESRPRVKADPGADANLMPIHHFRAIFPYLCDSSGQPNEGVLEKAESSFESYSGDSMTVIRQTKIYAMNKQTK